ncbi:regulator of G-protein signaling [Acrasis kona]|uniref:Regulator of G-protein signaling n=1 Tax=Acrasis kona TaxID=1008807 RepID=A0AAW2ZEW2_9EUKA
MSTIKGRFSFSLEDVLDDASTREHFINYLKRSFNDDCLIFLQECKAYQTLPIESRFSTAQNIINKYIKLDSSNEINISGPLRTSIVEEIDKFSTAQQDVPESLFGNAYYAVMRELKEDAFARYTRSRDFEEFINKKDKTFLSKYVATKRKETILNISQQDFNQKCIHEKDVKLMMRLSEDSHVWDALRKTKLNEKEHSAYTYISNPIKTLDGSKVLLVKYTGLVPYSAERTVNQMMVTSTKKKYWLKGQVKDEFMEYHTFENPDEYAISLSLYSYSMMKLLKPFECVKLNTVVYDTKRRCYMYIMKSTTAYGRHKDMKRSTPMTYLYSVQVNQVAENMCRYNIVLLYYMKKMDHPFVLKMAVSHAPYDVQNGIIAMMKEAESKGFPHEDDNRVSETLQDYLTRNNGGKTWDVSDVVL